MDAQPPPIDPNIQFALSYLLQALVHSGSYSGENPNGNDRPGGYHLGVEMAQPSGSERGSVRRTSRRKKKRSLPKRLSRDEVDALLKAPNLRAATGLRDRIMLELLYRAGLRVSEVCALELRDVEITGEQGTVRIVAGKGGDGTAYFDARSAGPDGNTLAGLMERWLEVRTHELKRQLGRVPPRAPLFCTLRRTNSPRGGRREPGGRVGTRQLEYMIKRRARKAGLDPALVTPHVLRHTFATELLEDGFNIREVQEAVRHADVSTTMVYTHVHDAGLARKISERRR
jgi:integrase/recombinase XerD